MTDDKPEYRDELMAWSKQSLNQLLSYYNKDFDPASMPEPRFSFVRGSEAEDEVVAPAGGYGG